MDKETLEVVVENQVEWRKHMLNEIKEIRKEVSGLRSRVAFMGSIFGIIGAYVKTTIFKQ